MQPLSSVIIITSLLLGLFIQPVYAATMGRTTDGNSSFAAANDVNYGSVFTATSSFMTDTIHVRVLTATTTSLWFAALYEVNGFDEPSNRLFQTLSAPLIADSWNSIPAPLTFIEAGTRYCIVVAFEYAQTISIENPQGPSYECSFAGGGPAPNPFLPIEGTYGWTVACYASGLDATATRTFTVTPTVTLTSTPTSTPTITPTSTPTSTPTITPSSTSTHSPTYTHTPTITLTTTVTYTSTITQTYTVTPTYTHSPTSTITPTITLTVIATPTLSPSMTPTDVPYKLDHDKILAYPCPARGDTMWFYFYTPAQSSITIEVLNVIGEKGDTIKRSFAGEGYQRIPWPLQDVAPGIYFYRATLQSPEGSRIFPLKKFVVVKGK